MKPKLTPKAYAKKGGCRCPACGDERIEGEPVDIRTGAATQDMRCTECDAIWTDVYELTGYADLIQP